MSYYKCEHKNLKYFEKTDKVICLDCGENFHKEFNFPAEPTIPYKLPEPMPDYPVYPIVVWTKVDDKSDC